MGTVAVEHAVSAFGWLEEGLPSCAVALLVRAAAWDAASQLAATGSDVDDGSLRGVGLGCCFIAPKLKVLANVEESLAAPSTEAAVGGSRGSGVLECIALWLPPQDWNEGMANCSVVSGL